MNKQEEIYEINFGWGFKPSPTQVALMEPFVKEGKPIALDKDGSLEWGCREFHMTIHEASRIGVEFSVVKQLKVGRLLPPTDIEAVFNKPCAPPPVNERCNLIVAGNAVMDIKEVRAFSDYCSDSLTALLQDDWMILAICVQPDQRRPDYILGRK